MFVYVKLKVIKQVTNAELTIWQSSLHTLTLFTFSLQSASIWCDVIVISQCAKWVISANSRVIIWIYTS